MNLTYLWGIFGHVLAASSASSSTTPFLNIAIALALIISLAKLGGYISTRLHQPAVLGELLVGLILGPSLLDFLNWPIFFYNDTFGYHELSVQIAHLAEFGVLLLMFVAGLELHLTDLAKSGRVAGLAGSLGVVFPLTLGWATGALFGYDTIHSIFIGLVLSATSVSISAQTLMEMGKLRTRVGIGMLGAAVFDDVLVVMGLSVFFAFVGGAGGGPGSIGLIFLRMLLFVTLTVGFGLVVLPRLTSRVSRLPISRGVLAFVFVSMLVYAWLAGTIGQMAPITGAFIAGLMFARSPLKERIEQEMNVVAYGIFVPIFFVGVGLQANLRVLGIAALGLFAAMTLVAILGKVLGAGLGAKLAGFDNREALQMGVGMMSRGEVGLIVANAGIGAGLIGGDVFAAVVGVVLVTTLLTPLVLRRLIPTKKHEPSQVKQTGEG